MIKSPVDFTLTILHYSAILPRPDFKYKFLYRFYYYYSLVMTIFILFSSLGFLFADGNRLNENLQGLQISLSALHVVTKHIHLGRKQYELRILFNELTSLWNEAEKDPANSKILTKSYQTVRKIGIGFFAGFYLLIPASMIPAVLMHVFAGKEKLPFPCWTGFTRNYAIAAIWQTVMIVNPLTIISYWCLLIGSVCIQAGTHMKILQNMLRNPRLRGTYTFTLHSRIIKVVKQLNELFSEQIFIEITLSSIQSCLAGYVLMKGVYTRDPQITGFIVSFILTLSLPYNSCFCGKEIQIQSEKIFTASYQNHWYEENIASRKNLLILSTVARKTLHLDYRNLIHFDMEVFLNILHGAFAYLSTLQVLLGKNTGI